MTLAGGENVHAHSTDIFRQRHHQFLADGIDGRVCHLCKLLPEVIVQELWFIREYGQGGVVAHRIDRFGPSGRHRGDDLFDVFF